MMNVVHNMEPGEYMVRFPGGTTLSQCACLYAWAGLVVHHWWVKNRCESNKKTEGVFQIH